MRLVAILLAFAVLSSCASIPVNPREPASVAHPPFDLSDQCRDFVRGLASDYKYGWVPSFVDGKNEEGGLVYVFYYHRKVKDKTPILVFNGGPVMDSHQIYQKLEYGENADLEKPWYVFMDQRGTGCSSSFPVLKDPKEYMLWGTEGIVRDAEVVRKVLGIPKWNIFGQSYGAFIVHRYLQLYPQSILTAVAHGGAPLSDYSAYNRLRYEQQLFVIKEFLKEYPEDEALIKNIVRKGRCLEGGELCGGYAVRALAASSLGFTDYWQFLHDKLRSLNSSKIPKVQITREDDDESANNDDYMADVMFWLNAELHGSNSAVNCNKVRRKALSILGSPELFAMSECWGRNGDEGGEGLSESEYRKAMADLKLAVLDNKVIRKNLEAHSEVQFYLFGSELDYYTPPAITSRAAGELGPKAKYEKLRRAGHESYLYAPVLRKLLPNLDAYLKAYGL